MANAEHLRILLSPDWDAWRKVNVSVTPDFTDADFTGQDLSGKDLSRTDLSRAKFEQTRMDRTNLTRATLKDVVMRNVQAAGAIFDQVTLDYLDLSDCRFPGARFTNVSARNTTFAGCDF